MWSLLVLATRVRQDPLPFFRRASEGTVRYLLDRGVDLRGARVLDLGSGYGALSEALADAGAEVVGLDLKDQRKRGVRRTGFVVGRAERLPFADGAFDIVVSSNILEHIAGTRTAIAEMARACRPGGSIYISWTTWFSPLGGHEMSPFQYLGGRFGLFVYRALRRRSPRRNVPGKTLFPVHVGGVLRILRDTCLQVTDVAPRYWPSLRLLARLPGVREFAMWNCVVLLEKPAIRPMAS